MFANNEVLCGYFRNLVLWQSHSDWLTMETSVQKQNSPLKKGTLLLCFILVPASARERVGWYIERTATIALTSFHCGAFTLFSYYTENRMPGFQSISFICSDRGALRAKRPEMKFSSPVASLLASLCNGSVYNHLFFLHLADSAVRHLADFSFANRVSFESTASCVSIFPPASFLLRWEKRIS